MAATRTPSSRVSAFSFLLRLILAGGVGLVLFLVANSPDQDRRLRMVCAVGACVSVFIFSHAMSGPRRQWVRGMVGRRFPHPSPALNRAGIRYLRAWDQWIRATCGIGTGAVMAVILRTSTEGPNPWFPALLPSPRIFAGWPCWAGWHFCCLPCFGEPALGTQAESKGVEASAEDEFAAASSVTCGITSSGIDRRTANATTDIPGHGKSDLGMELAALLRKYRGVRASGQREDPRRPEVIVGRIREGVGSFE